jgi:hypothetical protein
MNSSGYIRGYMAKNMKAEKFIEVVANAISREFEKEVKMEKTAGDIFNMTFDDYKVSLRKCVIEEFQSPYGIDRLVLEALAKQGFIFDRNRSQYIKYCFGKYN